MENENDENDDNCITESVYNNTIGSSAGAIGGGYNNTVGYNDDYYEKIERERKKKLRNDKINYLLDE